MKNQLQTTLALAGLLWLGAALPAAAATIAIVNADGPGEGFNDPTPTAPVGGNTGATRGQQRLIAFQFAADVWGALLPSDVEIRVTASFDPLTCTETTAVLGSAGPRQVFADFPSAPLPATWYPVALANKIAGVDLAPGAANSAADDIIARFNVSIDDAACLTGSDWYYGLDGDNGNDIDLVVVLLHEFGHGLGFISLVNSSTGALYGGLEDVYSNFLYDNTVGLHWPALTSGQRAASAINPRNVGFDGPHTVTAAADLLAFASELLVTAPAAVAGSYMVGDASFGPPVAANPVSGYVVEAVDSVDPAADACDALLNGIALAGNIALVDRGSCAFTVKVQAAQDAGAVGVIVVNNVAGPAAAMGGSSATITIPSVMVSQADGVLLRSALADGLYVSLQQSATLRAGMDPAGRPLVYTPNPLQQGSSVSHFDVSALPNLLMEPAINSDLAHDGVDLTLALFRDLGWFFGAPAPVPYAGGRSVLRQNAPNPFNPSTEIRFTLAQAGPAELKVFNVRGQHVRRLVAGNLDAGDHGVTWDGRDDRGARVPSGVYFYKLKAGDFEGMQRMVLLK
ncbi:MAG: T9SS type A sorting domain-containing protein [Krumholzibacteria bacterium]|nr:T9SS type A sorting domain-containing protein [Candidatus Krumholzibacteria bacterium]